MTQRLLRILPALFCAFLFISPNLFAQQKSPYKPLVTTVNTAVADTISGVNLDINLSNPQPGHGNLNVTVIDPGGGSDPWVYKVEYVPDAGFIGVDTFVLEYHYIGTYPYLVYRGFRVTVLPSKVIAATDYAVTAVNTPVTIPVLANDSGPWGPLSISGTPLANNGSVSVNGNQLVFTPESGFAGVAHINYVVCDALNTCKTASVHVGVHGAPQNDTLPIFTNKNQFIEVPLPRSGYSIFQGASSGTVQLLQGSCLRYSPNNNFFGTDQFVLKVVVNGVNYYKTVRVKVYNTVSPNQMAMDDVRYTPKDQAITFNVRDNDIGGLTVRSWSVPSNFPGTITGTNGAGNVTFTPNPGFSGVATFYYKIGNASAPALEVATVSIVVDNLAPAQVLPKPLQTPKATPIILHYDIPYTNFSFTILEDPDHGTLQYFPGFSTQTINGQSVSGNNLLVFTPFSNYLGDDDFALFFCPPNGECKVSKIFVKMVEIGGTTPPYCIADCAWPGDANNDGITNNKDLLPLGYVLGLEGNSRVNGSDQWYGQYSNDWNDVFLGMPDDLKHSDADGNGLIEAADAAAISENYNQVHNLYPKSVEVGKGLPFFLRLLTPDPQVGDLVQVEVSLGSENFPALDVYGFTLDVSLAQGVVDSAFRMNFFDNSWINLNSPCLELAERPLTGRFEMGFTRTNGQPVSGEGVIGVMDFIIVDIIVGGGQNERMPQLAVTPSLTGADGSTVFGAPIYLDLPFKLEDRNRKPAEIAANWSVFPVPAHETIHVQWANEGDVQSLELADLNGRRMLYQEGISGTTTSIEVSDLPAGMYFLTVKTPNSVSSQKVLIQR